MKELLYPYIFIGWIVIKTGVVKKTNTSLGIMIFIGVVMNVAVFFAHRFYSPVDLTNSSVVRAQTAILSPLTKSIDKYYITHNEKVKKGQLLYTLENNETSNNVTSIEAEIAQNQSMANQQKRDIKRVERAKDAVSERDYEKMKSDLSTIEFEIKALEADLKQAHFEASRFEVRAPFDGLVTRLDTAAGSRFGNVQLWNTATKILEMRIPDQVYSKIKKGQFAEFYVDALPGHIFRGRVHSITMATGESQGSHASGEQGVLRQLQLNSQNLGRTVLIEFIEPEGIDIPIGARGSAWISAEKPFALLGPIDMLGAATLRLSAIKSFIGAF
jgi:multidrug resistance efflux pump